MSFKVNRSRITHSAGVLTLLFIMSACGASGSDASGDGEFQSSPRASAESNNEAGLYFQDFSANSTYSLSDDAALDGITFGITDAGRMPVADPKLSATKDAEDPTTWKRSGHTPNASKLMIGDDDSLALAGSQASVHIDGWRARVLFDLYYFNDNDRQLEGTFKLRMPNGATPWYFAFGTSASVSVDPEVKDAAPKPVMLDDDVMREAPLVADRIVEARAESWNDVKEARMVQKDKAAFAYTETTRRRIDPALVEWSGAGMFSARVFPLASKQMHRIVFGYDVDLQIVGGNFIYALDLPTKTPSSTLDITIAKAGANNMSVAPQIKDGVALIELQSATESNASKDFDWHYHVETSELERIEVLHRKPGNTLLYGTDQAASYFAARVQPGLEVVHSTEKAMRPKWNGIFMLDTSLSSSPDSFNIWLKLLEETLNANRNFMPRFSVMSFGITQDWFRDTWHDNTPENVASLMAWANDLALEGATDLGAALSAAAKGPPIGLKSEPISQANLVLLSDGAATWGGDDIHQQIYDLTQNAQLSLKLFAYQTGLAGADTATLAALTRATGGAIFSVLNENQVQAAATAFNARVWSIDSVSSDGTSDLLIAGAPTHLYPNQELMICGRGAPLVKGNAPSISLALSNGSSEQVVEMSFPNLLQSDLASRAYGEVAVGQLEELLPVTNDVAEAYARHFRVPGKTCSLLMLESEADYQRYQIKPEEDAIIVGRKYASELVATTLETRAAELASSSKRFASWIARLKHAPGMTFNPSAGLQTVVNDLSDDATSIRAQSFGRSLLSRKNLDAKYAAHLSESDELDYEKVQAEALRRTHDDKQVDALVALSSLVERSPSDAVLLRDLAFTAMEYELYAQAYHLYRRVAMQRPYEPQNYRGMALALAAMGRNDVALVMYEVCLQTEWNERTRDFRKIVALEYLTFLRNTERGDGFGEVSDYAKLRVGDMVSFVDMDRADLIVTLMWNTDNTDVDLHVREPGGEECFYGNRQTKIGGRLTEDVTRGFGPEMYVLTNAKSGKYDIDALYFGSSDNRTSTRNKVYVTLYQNWGTEAERMSTRAIVLRGAKDRIDLYNVTVK